MFGGLAFLWRGRMSCGIVGGEVRSTSSMQPCGSHTSDRWTSQEGRSRDSYVSPSGFRTATALAAWVSHGRRAAEAKEVAPSRTQNPRHTTDDSGRRASSRARRMS
jgi:hypothetical protein